MNLLSIVIATYNPGSVIVKALESVCGQTFDDWECIVVDGGSTDETIRIVKEFESRDGRIRHISESDQGIYDAFNKGWNLAKGEWVYYLGADDELLKDGFSEFFKTDLSDVEVAYGDVVYKNPLRNVRKPSNPNIPSVRERLNTSHQGFIMKREVIERLGGFDYKTYRISADYHLILKSYLQGARFKYIPRELAIFNCTGVSGGYDMLSDCYCIRRELKSIPWVKNIYIYVVEYIRLTIRKVAYSLFGKN